jgi:arylsulfatase A-like enzyme
VSEREALAQLPAAPSGAPNVIFITLDTVGAGHTSLHGYHRQTTPNLEKWAKGGAWFKRAMVTAPWTLPAHATMFTGRYPHELSTTWKTPLDGTFSTVAEVLRDRGYETAGFVANRYYCGHDSGLSRGFIRWEDYNHSVGEFAQCSSLSKWFGNQMVVRNFMEWFDVYGRKDAEEVNRAFFTWLDDREERPFFAFLNYFDAHDPYLPPAPFDRKFGPPPTAADGSLSIQWWSLKRYTLTRENIEAAVRAHDSCIAYLDQKLGELLDELQRRGVLENTLVIVTSDHGEHFGEHGLYLHGQSLYRDLIHVPLVVLHPQRVPANKVVEDFVTLRDVGATILDIIGASDQKQMPGTSWVGLIEKRKTDLPAWRGSPLLQIALPMSIGYICPDDGCSPVASGPIVSLFKNGKYYIRNTRTGAEEVFDFDRDPQERENLVLLPEHGPLLQDFREEVDEVFAIHKSRWVDFP